MVIVSWLMAFVTASLYSNIASALCVFCLFPVFWMHKTTSRKALIIMIFYYAVTYYVSHMFEKIVDPILTLLGLPGYSSN